jgi:hypothetical protein
MYVETVCNVQWLLNTLGLRRRKKNCEREDEAERNMHNMPQYGPNDDDDDMMKTVEVRE